MIYLKRFSRAVAFTAISGAIAASQGCGTADPGHIAGQAEQALGTASDLSSLVAVSFTDSAGNAQTVETTAADMQGDVSGQQITDDGNGNFTLTAANGAVATVSGYTTDNANDTITFTLNGTLVTVRGFNANYAATNGSSTPSSHQVRPNLAWLWPVAVIVVGGAGAIVAYSCAQQESNAYDQARLYNASPNKPPCTFGTVVGPACARSFVVKPIPGCVPPPVKPCGSAAGAGGHPSNAVACQVNAQ